jgi:hypothetical protein
MIDCENGIGCDHGPTETGSHGGRPKTIVLTGYDHRSTEASSGGGATKMWLTTSARASGYRASTKCIFAPGARNRAKAVYRLPGLLVTMIGSIPGDVCDGIG